MRGRIDGREERRVYVVGMPWDVRTDSSCFPEGKFHQLTISGHDSSTCLPVTAANQRRRRGIYYADPLPACLPKPRPARVPPMKTCRSHQR